MTEGPVVRGRKTYRVGNHLYAICEACGKLVRITGFLAEWHICK